MIQRGSSWGYGWSCRDCIVICVGTCMVDDVQMFLPSQPPRHSASSASRVDSSGNLNNLDPLQ